jgi:hypothetical protein
MHKLANAAHARAGGGGQQAAGGMCPAQAATKQQTPAHAHISTRSARGGGGGGTGWRGPAQAATSSRQQHTSTPAHAHTAVQAALGGGGCWCVCWGAIDIGRNTVGSRSHVPAQANAFCTNGEHQQSLQQLQTPAHAQARGRGGGGGVPGWGGGGTEGWEGSRIQQFSSGSKGDQLCAQHRQQTPAHLHSSRSDTSQAASRILAHL